MLFSFFNKIAQVLEYDDPNALTSSANARKNFCNNIHREIIDCINYE